LLAQVLSACFQAEYLFNTNNTLFAGPILSRNSERPQEKGISQICLACGAENDAGEVICKKCGKPLRAPRISKKRDVLGKIAAFAILIIVVVVVVLVLRALRFL
jgi:predicted nucleic acid-binding Zn ribbon protein